MKSNQYNLISPIYNTLKQMVFGDKLIEAEIHFLKNPNEKSSLLVVGCGTADFLSHIDLSKFDQITCLDKSRKMIETARKTASNRNLNISFLNCDFREFELRAKYDLISLPFFLDCQKDTQITEFIAKCYDLLKKDGQLIITDFYKKQRNSILSTLLLSMMYIFFKIVTNIERMSLPDYKRFLDKKKWEMEQEFYQTMVNVLSLKIKKRDP